MALVEKTRKVTEAYLVTVCDGCGSEEVTTNIDDKVFCDTCLKTPDATPVDTGSVVQ